MPSRLIYLSIWFFSVCIFLTLACFLLSRQFWPQTWPTFFTEKVTLAEVDEARAPALEATAAALAQTADARAHLVANFIERNDSGHNSPLQPYDEWGQLFVAVADEYGLDFRLLPAIARKESTFCKSNIAQTYYNCFGYGVPASGITDAGKFSSYEEGLRTVAASLKRNYLDKGLTSPEAIMNKYCPPSNGEWAAHLNQWLEEMRYDDKAAGQNAATDADLTEFTASP